MKWLNDNKLLRNAFTIIVWLVAYAAALIYFGLFKNLDIDSVVLFDTGALTIIGFFAVKVLRYDITGRAFIDENLNNPDLVIVNDGIVVENKKIENDDVGQEYLDGYNSDKQKRADKDLTDFTIAKLRKKLRIIKVKTKKPFIKRIFGKAKFEDYQKKFVKYYTEQIKLLETNPIFNKKHKNLKYQAVTAVGDLVIKKTMSEHDQINYNPKKDAWWSWFFSIFKFVGIGATSIPFAINRQDWSILGAFYIALTVTALITVIRRYLGIRKRTGGPYLQARRFKWNIMKSMNRYILDKESKLLIKKNQEVTDKAFVLRTDQDVVFLIDGNKYSVTRKDFKNLAESPGQVGFGDSYKLAYDDMLVNQQTEIFLVGLSDLVNDHFIRTDEDYMYTHIDTKYPVKIIDTRFKSLGYKTSVIEELFSTKAPIIRIKYKKLEENKNGTK